MLCRLFHKIQCQLGKGLILEKVDRFKTNPFVSLRLVQLLGTWATILGVGGSNVNPGLGLAIVTQVSTESLYPHCSSVPSCKIGTWLQLGWQKRAKLSWSH